MAGELVPLDGEPGPPPAGSVLALLVPGASPVPLLHRERELHQLTSWVRERDSPQCRVMIIGGPAGAGKSRVALELARSVGATCVTGSQPPGSARDAYQVIPVTGRRPVILVDDADLRADLVKFLHEILAHSPHQPSSLRVLLAARSASGLAGSVVARAVPPGGPTVSAPPLELGSGLPDGADDGVFRTALAGYADLLGVEQAALRAVAGEPGASDETGEAEERGAGKNSPGPFGLIMARALLAALDARDGPARHGTSRGGEGRHDEVRRLSAGRVAEGLMRHERDWWTAATEWDWGAADPPSRVMRDRAIAAVTLLGARSVDEAADVLCLVPGLAEAPASRRRAVAAWITALYPAGGGLPLSLASEWFVVRQLTASPSLAGALRSEITAGQQARALGLLARAAGWVRGAEQVFGTFADGDADRQVHAMAHAGMADNRAAARLDGILAGQLRSPAGVRSGPWTAGDPGPGATELAQLARLDVAAGQLPAVHAAIAARRVARYRALAARSAVYWPGLAEALRSAPAAKERGDGNAIWYALDHNPANLPRGLRDYLDGPRGTEPEARVVRAWLGTARKTPGFPNTYRQRIPDFPARLHAEGLGQDALEAAREAVAVERADLAARACLRPGPGAPSRGLGLALRDLGDALDRLGYHHEALLATRELASTWRAGPAGQGDPEIAYLPEALLDLSIRLAQAGQDAEASGARAEMLQLVRDRLTRQATFGHPVPGWSLFSSRSSHWPDPPGRVVAELSWDEAAARGRNLLRPDGRADLRGLLEEFAVFWREYGQLPRADGWYLGVPPDRVLAALLRRAVGTTGSVEVANLLFYPARRPQRRVLRARVDVVVRQQYTDASNEPAEHRAVIQMHEVVRHQARRRDHKDAHAEELAFLDRLLAQHQLNSGTLVLIDRRPRRAGRGSRSGRAARRGLGRDRSAAELGIPDPRIYPARTPDGRDVTVVAC